MTCQQLQIPVVFLLFGLSPCYLREFVEDAKASGLVARTIERNAVRGLTVAPLASVK